jgi:predicted enzyme related to lactoylglutathione lyase
MPGSKSPPKSKTAPVPSVRGSPTFFGPMLVVRDFENALKFYRDLIGLPGDGKSPYAEFAGTGSKLVLLDYAFWKSVGGGGIPTSGTWKREGVVLAIQVEDVDSEYRRLRATGVAISSPPTDRPMMGLRNLQVFDPDGNLVELTAPIRKPEARPDT